MRKIVLMLALVAMVATSANAATYVWWTMTSGNGTVTQQGTPAGTPSPTVLPKALIIEKGLTGPYMFELNMWIASDQTAATRGNTGYRTNLWTGDSTVFYNPQGAVDGSASNLNPMGWTGPGGNAVNTAVPVGPALKVLDNFGKSRAGSETPIRAAVKVATFTLLINEPTEFASQYHYLYQTVGTAGFSSAPVTDKNLYFGPNPFVDGSLYLDTWAAASVKLPVIIIHAIPEPGTLMLLGLGLVGLIRRR